MELPQPTMTMDMAHWLLALLPAKNNGFGVVGVAPGARLWDVKVLDSQGNGLISDIIKGVDYVTGYADQIDVVNLSFGCNDCFSPALDSAIQNSISKRIVYVASSWKRPH